MSAIKKTCVYKNCQQQPGDTLFKFPLENARFATWCINAGLNVEGDIDITKTRYLCEKHFSSNYISTQSRRKMLVHTAVPFKYSDKVVDEVKFNIVGEPPMKKKKSTEYSSNEAVVKQRIETHIVKKLPEKKVNIVRIEKVQEDPEPEITLNKNPDGDTYEIAGISKPSSQASAKIVTDTTRNQIFKQITLKPQARPQKFVYVKTDKPAANPVKTVASPPKPVVMEEPEQFILIEEIPELSSSSLQAVEEKPEEVPAPSPVKLKQSPAKSPPQAPKSPETLESYSEFIFNGEKYVQMPKRIFEAEKEMLRKETEKYKAILGKLKTFVNKIDLE